MKYYKKIERMKLKIFKLQQELSQLYKQCSHERVENKLCESFAFDYTPRTFCVDCGASLGTISDIAEVKNLYKKELGWLWEKEISEEELDAFYQKNPRGFNL